MKRLGLLMMSGLVVGVVGFIGCGGDKDSPTGGDEEKLLVWTTTHDDGSVREEYQYYHHPETNQRMKDGWYNSYYLNGEYSEVGTYTENKRSGDWVSYTESGKETKGIYQNGNKWSGEFWINVKIDTTGWTETEDEIRDEDWVFRGLVPYDEGEWNGFLVLYWENGNKFSEGLYEDKKKEGKWVSYYESGDIGIVVCFKNNIEVGCQL